MEEKLLELITKLEALAPHVWALAVKQVLVDATRQLVAGLLALALAAVVASFSIREARKVRGRPGEPDITWYIFGVGFGAGVPFILALCLLYMAVGKYVNPQWYAIELLRGLIR